MPSGRRPAAAGTTGYPFLALALLLILVASPVVSLGGAQPVALGAVLTALTVAFLWLERLPLRPGAGIAAMLALALVGALPLASAADGEDPWFDYKSFAEGLGPDEPLAFDWGHNYGPLGPREGIEVLRVATTRPSYWKVRNLDDFDGARWTQSAGRLGGSAAEPDLAQGWREQGDWRETLRVTLRRIQTRDVIGAGTTLAVEDASREVFPGGEPGIWRSRSELRGGDSYTVRAHVPRPRPDQLTESGAGADPRRADDLSLTVPMLSDDSGLAALGRSIPVEVSFPPFAAGRAGVIPFTRFTTILRSNNGNRALRRSAYARSWGLAKRLKRDAETPYEYVLAVNRYLQDGFSYNETPAAIEPGRATLDGFLFDTRSGYCQHFSGAMALLLRMGGVPARVVTGFSPGGFSKSKRAWVVRDSDAHSWVEAWFDEWGWVAFDPTPAGTPARSQIAALERPAEPGDDAGGAGSDSGAPVPRDGAPRPGGAGSASGSSAAGSDDGGGGVAWWWFAPAVPLALALIAWCVLAWRRRGRGAAATLDRAVAELEAALRRAGRPAAAGTTLQQLEQRLGRTPQAAAYLRALRTGRYAPTASPPPPGSRRALRRELASGRGPLARLRALWALPPWRA